MVTRLQEAFEEVSKLPPDEQERWAVFILEEIEEERTWPTGDTGFDVLLREARREYDRGLSEPLEDLLAEDDD